MVESRAKVAPRGAGQAVLLLPRAYFAIIDYMRHTSIHPPTTMWLDEHESLYYEDYIDPFIQEVIEGIFASPNHRVAWKLKYEQDWKLDDIGNLLGVTATRVCQLNTETRNALKSHESIKVLKSVEG
jgi:DNA-directed RNA polymerase specialized sigma24 family protein